MDEETKKKRGRPKHVDGQTFDTEEVEMRYVFGELKIGHSSKRLYLKYPSVRELGKRYGITGSAIHSYLLGKDALNRRKEAITHYGEAGLIEYARSAGRWHPDTMAHQARDIEELAMRLPAQGGYGGPPDPRREIERRLNPEGVPLDVPPSESQDGRNSVWRLPIAEVDRIMVHGEPMIDNDNGAFSVRFPTFNELARRYGTTHDVIARLFRENDCQRRRENALATYRTQLDRMMTDYRIECAQEARNKVIGIVDEFVERFAEAVRQRRVRFDGPADFDRLVRLRELLVGAPDTRAEIQGHVTLEALQDRHQRYQAAIRGESVNKGDARVIEAVDSAIDVKAIEGEGEDVEDEIARLRERLAKLEGSESA